MDSHGSLGEQRGKVPSQLLQLSVESSKRELDGTAWLLASLRTHLSDGSHMEGSKVTLMVGGTVDTESSLVNIRHDSHVVTS